MTPISAEEILDIVRRSRRTMELPGDTSVPEWMRTAGGSVEYLCAAEFERALVEIISAQ